MGPQWLGDVRPADQFLGGDLAGDLGLRVRPRGCAATSAISFSLQRPASMPSRAWSAATLTESGHSGAHYFAISTDLRHLDRVTDLLRA